MSWFDELPRARRTRSKRVLDATEASDARPASFVATGQYRAATDLVVADGASKEGTGAEGSVRAPVATLVPEEVHRDSVVRAALLSVDERIEAARREGYEAGYTAGYEKGRADARASSEERRANLVARAVGALEEVAGAVASGRASALAIAQQDAARLAFELTRTLVGHELALATSPGMDAVRRALDLAPSGVDLFIHLHPDDAAMLPDLERLPEVVRRVQGCKVTVVPDPTVERGGCVVEAGACRIDAQIGTAMQRVRQVLLGQGSPEDVPPLQGEEDGTPLLVGEESL